MMQVRTIAKAILSRRWLPVTLLIVGLMALFVRLGFWQLDRLAQRRAANAALIAALEAQPLELNEQPLSGAPENLENRDVVVTGTFDYEAEIYLLLQNWQGRTGVHILTPLVMAGTDTAVLVDRGWIPQSEYETGDLSRFQTASDEVSITGYAALSQPPPRFADPQVRPTGPQREVYRVDLAQIAPQLPYSLLPIYVQQAPTGPNDATRLPLRAERQVDLSEGSHLSYAIQWFLFAALSGILFVVFIRRNQQTAVDPSLSS